MSNTNGELRRVPASSEVPNCPYKHLRCLNYDHVLEQGLCQPHTNKHHKSVRCCWLPPWVPDGWHLAVLRKGHLRVRRGLGGR